VSTTLQNVAISAVATRSASGVLYPGGDGEVPMRSRHTNRVPVTVAAVTVPRCATFAGGYTDERLTTPRAGCSPTTSGVIWRFQTTMADSARTLTVPLVVGANATLAREAQHGERRPCGLRACLHLDAGARRRRCPRFPRRAHPKSGDRRLDELTACPANGADRTCLGDALVDTR
jgi:hypothetical protein